MTGQPSAGSWFGRLRLRRPWLDHLVRANDRYTDRHGDHYAAAVAYFSVLAMVPLLMVAFAGMSLVLLTQPDLLAELHAQLAASLPPELARTVSPIIDQAISSAATVGVLGLLLALYSGLGWMTNLRDALSEQWGQPPPPPAFLRRLAGDLAVLIGLGVALVLSFGLTAALSGFAERAVGWFGVLVGVLVTVLADWLLFLWVFARLPREPVTWRSAARAALAAAVGLELIKLVMVFYLASVMQTPAGAAFGPILGLLVFLYVVSRLLLYLAAWAATAPDAPVDRPAAQPPPPAVIRSETEVRTGPTAGTAVGLVGAGMVGGLVGQLLLRRRR